MSHSNFVWMLVLVSTLAVAGQANLIPNGDFEEGMYEWAPLVWPRNSVIATVADGLSHGRGRRALLLNTPAGMTTAVQHANRLELPPQKTSFVFSFAAKKVQPTPQAARGKLDIKLYFSGDKVKKLEKTISLLSDDISGDWKTYNLNVTLPTGYQKVSFGIQHYDLKAPEKIYVDDLAFQTAE